MFIRILDPQHYKPSVKRFHRRAFAPNKGAISLFNLECAVQQSHTICRHIAEYYATAIHVKPAVYIPIQDELLQGSGLNLEQKTSDSGDDCHYDLSAEDTAKSDKVFELAQGNEKYRQCIHDPDNETLQDMSISHEALTYLRELCRHPNKHAEELATSEQSVYRMLTVK